MNEAAANTEIETLPDELIFEDSQISLEEVSEPTLLRTVAFLADKRTSDFLIAETVASLVTSQTIQHAIVDISTEAGTSVAVELTKSGIPFDVFDTAGIGDLKHFANFKIVPLNLNDITNIDANIVIMPAAADDAGPYVDVSPGTTANTVIEQLQAARLNCLMIMPPESGLRRTDDGSYVRLTLKLAE